jgi:hypothetical protein
MDDSSSNYQELCKLVETIEVRMMSSGNLNGYIVSSSLSQMGGSDSKSLV